MTNTPQRYIVSFVRGIPLGGILLVNQFGRVTMEDEKCCCPEESKANISSCSFSGRTKHRSEKEYKDLMNRLKRIEGQVRGLQKMLENDVYCPDILVQVSAVNCALNSFGKTLLASHIHTCVLEDIKAGHEEVVDELVETLQKVMK